MNRLLRGTAGARCMLHRRLERKQSRATVFAAWEVANVPFGDTLNVRKYPAGYSQKQAAYPNGTVLQMTGKCAGGVNLLDIANQPAWKQERSTTAGARSGTIRPRTAVSSQAGSTANA